MTYNNNNQQTRDYVRSSSCKKFLHFNEEQDPQTGKPRKEQVQLEFDVTEEISITLTPEKAQALMDQVSAAMQDPVGTGGVRISMYGKRSINQNTKEEFDGLGLLIYAQKPNPNGGANWQRGGFRGASGGGGGRRSYPSQQAQGNGQPQQQSGSQQGEYRGAGRATAPVIAPVVQPRQVPGPIGRGPTAPTSASPSSQPAPRSAQSRQAPASSPKNKTAPAQVQGPPVPGEDCPI